MPVLELVALSLDEFEAIRLADLENLYQEQAADRMKVSRQTFGNIIESAHRKIADVLVHGKALKIEGGTVSMRQHPGAHKKMHACMVARRQGEKI